MQQPIEGPNTETPAPGRAMQDPFVWPRRIFYGVKGETKTLMHRLAREVRGKVGEGWRESRGERQCRGRIGGTEGSVRDTQSVRVTQGEVYTGGREGCESWREGRGEAGVRGRRKEVIMQCGRLKEWRDGKLKS